MYKLSKIEYLRTLNKWSLMYLITVFNILPSEKKTEIRVYQVKELIRKHVKKWTQ